MRSLLTVAALLLAGPAAAEVVSTSAEAFTVRNTVEVSAPPAQVYAALGRPGQWWESGHTWSRDAANLSLDLRPGGCFCETLPNGGGVEHLRVVFARPGQLLRLAGALGPLQDQGVHGVMTFELKPEGAGTELVHTYVVRGFSAEEAKQWAAPVDGMLRTQLQRLERRIETGAP